MIYQNLFLLLQLHGDKFYLFSIQNANELNFNTNHPCMLNFVIVIYLDVGILINRNATTEWILS